MLTSTSEGVTVAAAGVQTVTLFFDPACPWTWRTSRWLVDVAARRGVPVEYRPFELSDGAPLDAVPEQYRAGAAASRAFLRVVEKAHRAGADAVTAAIYSAYGADIHDRGQAPSLDLVSTIVTEPGGPDYAAALGDGSLDAGVAAARAEARGYAGDDIGSPVLVLAAASGTRGFFGPVLAPTPTGDHADRLWELLASAAAVPEFFELKTRRTASPTHV